jgi:hypothetical protein
MSPMRAMKGLVALSLLAMILLVAGLAVVVAGLGPGVAPALAVPSQAGLNYGMPHTASGEWVGTQWLRPSYWGSTQPALAADLDFIQHHNLGRVMRVFIGLDQLMVWNANAGFDGFDEVALQNMNAAFDMFDARGIRIIAVLYDQEVVGSPGNFHFAALDGKHEIMRRNYLRATDEFMRRFGERSTVIGWDLFNEAYNSLGQDGHLPLPPHADPVSPNFSDQLVHQWLSDLYGAAKRAAPAARFTISDATELYWNPDPDVSKYSDVVDFYDIHIYDDHPNYPNWKTLLRKPYIVGEAGASTVNQHYDDQTINSNAVAYLLEHAQSAGVSTVLIQGLAFTMSRDSLTPTGSAIAHFLSAGKGGATASSGWDPAGAAVTAMVSAGRRLKRLVAS